MRTLFLFILLAFAPFASAVTRHVPAEFTLIQNAILACQNGDTVLVAEGTYVENFDFRGRSIVVASLYLLDGDVAHIPLTLLDGSQPVHSDSGSVVSIISGEDSTTALIGFTITGGTGTKFRDQDDNQFYVEGGGIIIENSDPLIAFNFIVYNEATRQVQGALSSGGGGIRYGYCAPKIQNNIIMHNSGKYGGGVVSFFADGELQHNVIASNSGGEAYGGGGLWMGGAGHTTTVINNTIVGNESVQSGGGIRLFAGVLNGHSNIVWGNRANSGSQQVGGAAGSIHLDYNCVEGGFAGVENINEYPQFLEQNLRLSGTSPCIDAGNPDSQWEDEDETRNDMGIYGGPGATWYMPFGEPSISLPVEHYAFFGIPRVGTILVQNLGTVSLLIDSVSFATGEWFEVLEAPQIVNPVSQEMIELLSLNGGDVPLFDTLLVYHNDLAVPNPWLITVYDEGLPIGDTHVLPFDYALYPAFPNPFNPSTTIRFSLPNNQLVNITIHDIQGREVTQLLHSRFAAGEHAVEWNATGFSSGTYFVTLRAGKWHAQTKLTLLK